MISCDSDDNDNDHDNDNNNCDNDDVAHWSPMGTPHASNSMDSEQER